MTAFTRGVHQIVRRVPPGRVISYGAVAALLGSPRAARAVGAVMRGLPDGTDVPWWRVINGEGGISPRPSVHAARVQRALLEDEGVRFDRNGRIDWDRYGWSPDATGRRTANPAKRAVALAIREPGNSGRLLLVRRPADDAELPGAWGLPAASRRANESWEEAARRAARDKLGVSVRLHGMRREGSTERVASTLHMRLFDATLHRGVPRVPQRTTDVTQYTDCRWGTTDDLRPAARRGSLCCRLALESVRPAERAAAARQRPER